MNGPDRNITFSNQAVVGKGSFGDVFKTILKNSDEPERNCIFNKVLQDKRYKIYHFKSNYHYSDNSDNSDSFYLLLNPHYILYIYIYILI